MKKNLFFLGTLYPPHKEKSIKNFMRHGVSDAPNVFQWSLISGINHWIGDKLNVVNVLPVGTWPKAYKQLFLKDNNWNFEGVNGVEIGCVNLPFIKQLSRARKIKKYLKKLATDQTEILIYSAYMPFLKAVYKLPKGVKITAIITDLPEYYDLGNVSKFRKYLRSRQNKLVYKYLERVDRFVVLTKQMCEKLNVANRPWICVEGICNASNKQQPQAVNEAKGILYSGTLHYQYGIKNLLEAFKLIDDDQAELWICGSGEASKEIEQLAQKDKRVKFYGYCTQEQVAILRQSACVLVNPRTNEGEYTKYSFPSKTMEYMASGKPVVMYKLDGIPNEYDEYLFYADGSNGIEGLATKLKEVLNNYDQALKRAEGAKKLVLENKNAKKQAEKILEFIEKEKIIK